jgi:hypothetical protein
VIEQTIRQKLPEGFQRAEFLLEKGFLEAVVHPRDLKAYLIRALDFLKTPVAARSPLSCFLFPIKFHANWQKETRRWMPFFFAAELLCRTKFHMQRLPNPSLFCYYRIAIVFVFPERPWTLTLKSSHQIWPFISATIPLS